jgi:hypothetical protein
MVLRTLFKYALNAKSIKFSAYPPASRLDSLCSRICELYAFWYVSTAQQANWLADMFLGTLGLVRRSPSQFSMAIRVTDWWIDRLDGNELANCSEYSLSGSVLASFIVCCKKDGGMKKCA